MLLSVRIVLIHLLFAMQLSCLAQHDFFNDVFVLGNSLTLGFGTHGMASSNVNTDYYYLVHQAFLESNSNLSMRRQVGTTWEGGDSESRAKFLRDVVANQVTGEEDLILIQLGDNVDTDQKKATLKKDAKFLIEWFRKKCPEASIAWIYGWYQVPSNMPIITEAIEECEYCTLVDISDIRFANGGINQSTIGSTYINDLGETDTIMTALVAGHPGDLGMEAIASRVIEKLKYIEKFRVARESRLLSTDIMDMSGKLLTDKPINQIFIVREIYSNGVMRSYKEFVISN